METIQETQELQQRPRICFVGKKRSTYVWAALCIGLLIFAGTQWKVYEEWRKGIRWWDVAYTAIYFLLLAFAAFFRIKNLNKKQTLVYHIALTVVAAFLSYYQIEMLGFNDIIKEEIQALFVNWGLILVVYLLGYVITNRFRGAIIFGNIVCFALALVNHLVFLFRGTPFLPNDIFATQTAMSVLQQMSYEITPETFLGLLPFLLNFAIAGHMTYKNTDKKVTILTRICGTAVVAFTLFLCICTDALLNCGTSISYWNTIKSCNANGELMQFMIYIRKSQVEKPEDYGLEMIEGIQLEYKDTQDGTTEAKPNVIVIMNEAFSDLSVIRDFDTNEEYFPYYNSLTENCIKGNMIASIKGGGTCNTEFEFLTGSSHAFLPAACLPYQQYINKDMPSMAWIMQNAGYEVMAAHPYYATGWRRSTVYPLLGFDRFDSIDEYPSYAQKGRLRLVTDYANYQYLIEQYEKQKQNDQPFFIFNVTMQNHSGYSTDYDFGTRITVDDFKGQEGSVNAEVYLSLMKQSDSAFKYLIEYFEKEEEPTIIVMFGDHQPGDMNAFLDWLSSDLSDSLEDVSKLYTVPYIIWSNYEMDMDLENTEYISANYLSSMVMDLAGVDLPAYNEFLMELRQEYPVVSSKICVDTEGNYLAPKDVLQESEILRHYQLLQYNNLFDSAHRDEAFYYGFAKDKK